MTNIKAILAQTNALIQDSHIVYTSGRHGSAYVNKDAVYPHTHHVSQIGLAMAKCFMSGNVEAVLAPAIGGVILSQWTAYHLSEITRKNVLSTYAEKESAGDFVIKRGYDGLIKGKNVLVVEDVVTTGGSLAKVIAKAREVGAKIAGAICLCNRGGIRGGDLGVDRFESLVNINFASYEAADCPMCKEGKAINTSVGKGLAVTK